MADDKQVFELTNVKLSNSNGVTELHPTSETRLTSPTVITREMIEAGKTYHFKARFTGIGTSVLYDGIFPDVDLSNVDAPVVELKGGALSGKALIDALKKPTLVKLRYEGKETLVTISFKSGTEARRMLGLE